MKTQLTFGVMVGTRGFFNPKLAVEGRRKLLAALDRGGPKQMVRYYGHYSNVTRGKRKMPSAST